VRLVEALRRVPGLERVKIGVFVIRDAISGIGDGTCLVRRWSEDVVRELRRPE